ncbi:MAG: iron-sulfur cluster assembly protein, partial [Pseudomonadota bacterium]
MTDPDRQISQSDAFAEAWAEPQKSALSQAELDRLTDDLITALKTVFDPEIPVDIYELGLIYKVDV